MKWKIIVLFYLWWRSDWIIMDFERRVDKIRIYTSITYPFCESGMTSNGWSWGGCFGLCCCWLFTSTLVLNYRDWWHFWRQNLDIESLSCTWTLWIYACCINTCRLGFSWSYFSICATTPNEMENSYDIFEYG